MLKYPIIITKRIECKYVGNNNIVFVSNHILILTMIFDYEFVRRL